MSIFVESHYVRELHSCSIESVARPTQSGHEHRTSRSQGRFLRVLRRMRRQCSAYRDRLKIHGSQRAHSASRMACDTDGMECTSQHPRTFKNNPAAAFADLLTWPVCRSLTEPARMYLVGWTRRSLCCIPIRAYVQSHRAGLQKLMGYLRNLKYEQAHT